MKRIGRGSEMTGDVQAILIVGEDVAGRLLCAVAAGKEDEGVGLLLNAKRYGPFQ